VFHATTRLLLVLSYLNNTRSVISSKWTSTLHESKFGCAAELWIKAEILPCRILLALNPKTNNSESMTFDFPEPLGPTTEEKDYY